MILRKPYAFFIKHFKLIHLVLAVFAFYSIYKTKLLLDFFNEYSLATINVAGQDLITPLLPTLFQIIPILIIIFSIVVLVVMAYKKKPYLFYIITIIIYVYVIIITQVSKGTLNTLYTTLIDVRTIRLIRDLITIAFATQIFSLVIILVRATGFDVKKFDFKSDLKELNVSEEDREEVEVQINFDPNKKLRNIRKKIRYLKYGYKENRLFFNSIFIVATISLVLVVILTVFNGDKIIKQNVYFYGNNFTVKLTDSYLVNTDYKGRVIDDDYYYLLLKLEIKNNTNRTFGLDIATTKILIDNYTYTPTTKNSSRFFDFGKIYQNENIGQEFENKILVYEIPKELINDEIIFSFVDKNTLDKDGNLASTKVLIEYQDLTGISSRETVNLTEDLSLEDSILSDYKININSFEVANSYKLEYNFCISNECYRSYEYLKSSITSNYDKVLLKINGSLVKQNNIDNIYDLYDFIEYFGNLSYVIDGKRKVQNIQFKEVKSKKVNQENTYYIEVLKEVENASSVSLLFTIRNRNYEYVLK